MGPKVLEGSANYKNEIYNNLKKKKKIGLGGARVPTWAHPRLRDNNSFFFLSFFVGRNSFVSYCRRWMSLRMRSVRCKSNSKCKMNSRKEIKIRVFGSAMENSPENDFQCLVTF